MATPIFAPYDNFKPHEKTHRSRRGRRTNRSSHGPQKAIQIPEIRKHTRRPLRYQALRPLARPYPNERHPELFTRSRIPNAITDVHRLFQFPIPFRRPLHRQLNDRLPLYRIIRRSRRIFVITHSGTRQLQPCRIPPSTRRQRHPIISAARQHRETLCRPAHCCKWPIVPSLRQQLHERRAKLHHLRHRRPSPLERPANLVQHAGISCLLVDRPIRVHVLEPEDQLQRSDITIRIHIHRLRQSPINIEDHQIHLRAVSTFILRSELSSTISFTKRLASSLLRSLLFSSAYSAVNDPRPSVLAPPARPS